MAKLALTITFETTEEYEQAVQASRRLRLKGQARTAADQLGEQVTRVLGGLHYVEKSTIEVLVATVESGHHTTREKKATLPVQQTLFDTAPAEKRRVG